MRGNVSPEYPTTPAEPMVWNAWGSPHLAHSLSPHVVALLHTALGVTGTDAPATTADLDIVLRRSTLTAEHRTGLTALLGSEHVLTDDSVRILHLGGKSTPDLLRRRLDTVHDAPDAVLYPGSHDDVSAVLAYCTDNRIAVVAFGGGTSVVGGVQPERGGFDSVVAVDLRRLNALLAVDARSRTATLQAGVTGPQADELLARHSLALGHYPQSFRYATVGGFAATRSSGQASSGYGRFDDMVRSLTVATPRGTISPGRAPASAAGPNLLQVFLGSEGTLGIITDVTVRVHDIAETTLYRAWSVPSFDAGAAAFRALAGSTIVPTVMRLSDEVETGIDSALGSTGSEQTPPGACLAIMTFEGSAASAEAAADRSMDAMSAAGATPLDDHFARSWEDGRFDAPYLRDALLSAGALAETVETAASWSDLSTVRDRVTRALVASLTEQGTPPLVMCHLSHVYPTGASLYFTVACARAADPIDQWNRAKQATGDAIEAAGATITHHHGVGQDHRRWMVDEIGAVGVAILESVKAAVDPAGILNPGKLIP